MGMKTILVPTENTDTMRSALEIALALARRCDSYIEGFALTWSASEFVAVDMMGGMPLEKYRQDSVEEAKQARQNFEAFMREHGVPRSIGPKGTLSFGWLDDAPEGESFVGSYGRVFDVIVMGRATESSSPLHLRAIESGLFDSGRLILLSPPSPLSQIATNVLIAWNGSTEQASAIALAIPLIQTADRVTVLTVTGGTGVPGPTAAQVIQYLQRNGIPAGLHVVGLDGKSTGEAILAAAQSLGCDLLIKGAYTQSRLRQMIFGGATQHVLANATLPVLLAN
jgi:nucleotide-binding universal stress UspA family protein